MGKPRTACRRDPERKEASRLDAQAAIARKGLHGLVAEEGGLVRMRQIGWSSRRTLSPAARQIWAGPLETGLLIVAGLWLALAQVVIGIVFCLTVNGIPFGIACFKMAGLALSPMGKEIVDADDPTAAASGVHAVPPVGR